MIYYISDLHFGHKNVLAFDERPFRDLEEMERELIRRWNERVTEEDTVYVLGDVFWKQSDHNREIMARLKGHKHLIIGNHDEPARALSDCWESMEPYAEVQDEGRWVVLSHYPMPFFNHRNHGAVMLYGHVHRSQEWAILDVWQDHLRAMGMQAEFYNVGCMMDYMNYAPRTLTEILRDNAPRPEA